MGKIIHKRANINQFAEDIIIFALFSRLIFSILNISRNFAACYFSRDELNIF